MEDTLIQLLKEKFLNNSSKKDEVFFDEIKGWLDYHEKEAENNKNAYFSNNMKLGTGTSIKIGIGELSTFIKVIISSLGITFIAQNILTTWQEQLGKGYNIIVVLLGVTIPLIYGLISFSNQMKQKELKLRQYGETWIRHRVVWWKLKQEVMKYVYEIGEYELETKWNQKQLFMSHIISIENADMEKFENNMKDLEEVIE